MTDNPAEEPHQPGPAPLIVRPFPVPADLLSAVQFGWDVIGDEPSGGVDLPRTWDPGSPMTPDVRADLVAWLHAVVQWINHQHVWDPSDLVPPCWPSHSHLVHDLAVVAELRRRAGQSSTPDALDQWHTHTLPNLLDRMRSRLRHHCDTGHQPSPSAPAHARYDSGSGLGLL